MTHPYADVQWQPLDQPILSGLTTKDDWSTVVLYNGMVVKRGSEYLMWYCGNNTFTRETDHKLGLARSTDGIHFTTDERNPILTGDSIPFGSAIHTPFVMWDEEAALFKMWFGVVRGAVDGNNRAANYGQSLGYATSADGIDWDVHPDPLWQQIRGACVLREGNSYVMWAGAAPNSDDDFGEIVKYIWRFTSTDGLEWQRDPEPCITPSGNLHSTVYPFVHHDENGYIMWYGAHQKNVHGGLFQIHISTSDDGITWTHRHDTPVLPASQDPCRYDGRYTSMPNLIVEDDRLLLYFSTRDLGALYGAGNGTIHADAMGIYRHISVAVGTK